MLLPACRSERSGGFERPPGPQGSSVHPRAGPGFCLPAQLPHVCGAEPCAGGRRPPRPAQVFSQPLHACPCGASPFRGPSFHLWCAGLLHAQPFSCKAIDFCPALPLEHPTQQHLFACIGLIPTLTCFLGCCYPSRHCPRSQASQSEVQSLNSSYTSTGLSCRVLARKAASLKDLEVGLPCLMQGLCTPEFQPVCSSA